MNRAREYRVRLSCRDETFSLCETEQAHPVDNITDSLSYANRSIQKRMVENIGKAERELGRRVSNGLKP